MVYESIKPSLFKSRLFFNNFSAYFLFFNASFKLGLIASAFSYAFIAIPPVQRPEIHQDENQGQRHRHSLSFDIKKAAMKKHGKQIALSAIGLCSRT